MKIEKMELTDKANHQELVVLSIVIGQYLKGFTKQQVSESVPTSAIDTAKRLLNNVEDLLHGSSMGWRNGMSIVPGLNYKEE